MSRPLGSTNRSGSGERARDTRAAGKDLVLSLIRLSNEARTQGQSISGTLGAEIKEAAENHHLDPGALKLIAKCARMNELKRNAFLAAFDVYREYAKDGGLFGGEHVGNLVDLAAEARAAEIKITPELAGTAPFGAGVAG